MIVANTLGADDLAQRRRRPIGEHRSRKVHRFERNRWARAGRDTDGLAQELDRMRGQCLGMSDIPPTPPAHRRWAVS